MAEDPKKMIKQIIIDIEEQLRSAVQGRGTVMASERQMLKQLEDARSLSELWEEKVKTPPRDLKKELAKQAVDNNCGNTDDDIFKIKYITWPMSLE